MNRKIVSLVFVSLLILSTVIVAAALITTPVVAAGGSAWLKIVSTEWIGTSCAGSTTLMCPDPTVRTFPERYNVTGQRAFVEVYAIDPVTLKVRERQFVGEPNATGFVKISWNVADDWGLLILVKAKGYYGERIGEGSAFKGIIMYALVVGPDTLDDFAEKMIGSTYNDSPNGDNGFYVKLDGTVENSFDYPTDNYMPGPFGFLRILDPAGLKWFAEEFGAETTAKTPANAWVATAAVIFPEFYVHSFYDSKDAVPFAQVKIYDLDHTDPKTRASLIQAFVTGEDGHSRYTREIYPKEEGLKDGAFENNKIVPIPLQVINLNLKQAYNKEMDRKYGIKWPHLNATARVWWETVVVGHAIFYGHTANGTTTSGIPFGPVDPLASTTQSPVELWATVLYGRFCTYDADPDIRFPDVIRGQTGDELINALVGINLKTKDNVAYYVTKNLLTTDIYGCTDDPHKYRGGMYEDTIENIFARFPNATIWIELYEDADGNGIPDYFEIVVDAPSFWIKFGEHVYFNASVMYNPADAKNLADIPEGPNLLDIKNPRRIGDEDVLESTRFKGNWSMLVADVPYANTLTLTDDKPFEGMDVIVKWKGGWRNIYPGSEEQVAAINVKNPYGIALKYTGISFTDNPAEDWLSGYAAVFGTYIAGVPYIPPPEYIQDYREELEETAEDIISMEGVTYIWAHVYDIEFVVVDALGNPLPAGETEVCLRLPNGNFYCRIPSIDESLETGIMWSYARFGEGHVVFFQLPGNKGPYGVRVKYFGMEVYYEIDEINYLSKTVLKHVIRASVYKAKIVFLDCQDKPVHKLWIKYTMPDGRTDWMMTSPHGEVEFPFIPAGTLTISRAWFKGVEISLMKAEDATGKKIELTAEKELKIDITSGIDLPVKVWVPIKDIIFYTTDFQGEYKIPFLNITVTWIGTPKPWSTTKIYYLETLDPTGDTIADSFNTSVTIHPIWFSYKIDTFFQKIKEDSPMEGLVEYEAKYVFYQMPPAFYNITVTTTPDTPGSVLWPGRKVEVPYEIKIDWKGWSEKYEDTIPEIRTTPPEEVNDRVVLRIFGTMDGKPVTTDNFPAWLVDAWNPDMVGDRTALVCKENITLKTWAHDFWTRVVDGDLHVGDAQFRIENDNEVTMRFYDVVNKMWIGEVITSKWTEDVKLVSVLDKVDILISPIFWNGSYLLTHLRFETNMTYSYSKGENASFIVDKFYNKTVKPNEVASTLNFTLVGTENLWKTDRRFAAWVKRIEGPTWKDWYKAWFLVYELPKDTDEYKVAKGPDGKGILPIPLPVAFVKLGAFAKGGEPLNKALIELWTLHLDVNASVKISAKDEDCKTIYYYVNTETPGTPIRICWKWEKKLVETAEPQVYDWKRWNRVWLNFTVDETTIPIFVQVPPSPAKLILRNVVDNFDFAISADYVYLLLEGSPRDNNVGEEDKWGEEHGILSYGRWYTDADGYVDSFKAFGPADPRYGSIILPTAGWLNETFHDNNELTKDEFHYQINIVWKSAVVYSDNIVLDKKGYVTGPSEVYTVTFYLALSNSTKAPVEGLNAWIYYPNVTEWWSAGLWHTVPPEPQDYEACKDSIFKCKYRVTLASEAWAEGRKTFELIPGPRFMNTTWKYVFSANYTAIDWMDDLVATRFVLNSETFGDGALRVKTTTRIDVPIMLNAARWVVFEVATWRDEAGVPTAYPMKDYIVKYEIRKPKYLSGPALTAASGQAATDAEGKVVLTSDPSDPRKVFWAGMIIRYRVEPPTYTSNYADEFWSDWLKAKGVDFADKSADYRAPAVPPIMSHAYYPDEEPTHYAIAEIGTWWVPRSEGGWWCAGLCVHDYRSKPFIVWVDYTAVTVRVTDYNGRPLPGAFVQLWDKASGKIAAWHYTAAKEWEALPLDVAGMIAWHGLDPATDTIKIPFQTKPRMFGGAGFTGVMNVTVGPVAFDTNNDDRIDVNLPCRGVPDCQVSGASTSFITYIARAFWLSTDKKPTEATGALVAVWPYMPNVAQKVYDSEEDEITWKLLLPRYVAGAAFRPGMAPYYPQVLYIPTTTAPTGSLVKEHRDVYAAVFDIKMRFSYEGKPLGDIAKDLEVTFEKAYDVLAFKGKDVVDVKFLPRGTYTVIAMYKGVEVARRTLDLSAVNVGTVTADIPLAMRDVSVQVVDMFGRPLVDASITASPNYYAGMSNVGGVITIRAIVTTQTYEFTVSWKSDVYGTEANTIIADTPDGLAVRKVIELPVGDVTITVVDREGKPVGGAKVTIGKATLSTDSEGKAVFQQVPLEKGARGITYDVSVERDGVTIKESITFSRSKTTATLIAELFTLKVRVVGSAGQGLPFAKVIVKRAGVEIGTYTTDAGGFLEVPNLPLADYSVEAEWKGFKGTATATRDDLTKGRAVEISLPPYMEIAGIPFTLAAFLGLVIGLVILVIVIVILIIEYARWRGRRLGIYPPPPPKK